MKFRFFLLLLLYALSVFPAMAQHNDNEGHETNSDAETAHEEGDAEHEFKHHYIGFHIGHTHVSSGISNGDRKWLTLPSFGLAYIYGFNPKWGLGVHAEMIVEDFLVQGSSAENALVRSGSGEEIAVIERGRPIGIAVIGIYKVHPHIGLFLGGGMEFSEHEDFALVKVGAEFPYHFAPGWEMFGTLSADFKIDAYNSFSFGFGVARLF